MKTETKSAPTSADSSNAAHLILLTALSTTLRVFAPTLGLFGIGAVIDHICQSKPLGMALGVSVGSLVAILLIVLQIKKIKRESQK